MHVVIVIKTISLLAENEILTLAFAEPASRQLVAGNAAYS
jgi:hypothetical protein